MRSEDALTSTRIDGDELSRRIGERLAPPIIDVRTAGEFARGHVPGAVHLPFLTTFWRARELRFDRAAPVVVYCGHGPRAALARLALRRAGFRHVALLEGHLAAWRRAGLPLEIG